MSQDLVAALRRAGVGDVDDSTLTRALYSADASLYRVVPQVVARPRDTDELAATVAVARDTGTPLTMRGAGTSIAGNAVGTGIVVDAARHLNRVLSVDPEARTATVQPGTVHATLQKAATRHGLRFGPDPSTHTRCTIGGMIGNNACGSRALGYGRTADNVVALDVLTADGGRLDGTRTPLHDRLDALVADHLATIRTGFGRFTRQVSGYSLEHLLPERGRNLDRFLVGSEGTLGVVAGATVRLVEDAPARALAVLGYADMFEAADAVPSLLHHPLVACEGLDARIVDVVRARRGTVPDLPRGAGWLFAEVTGATVEEARAAADRRGARRRRGRRTAGDGGGRDGRALADPRGRRGPRRAAAWSGPRTPAGRTPRCRRTGWAPTCAASTRCCATPASTGCPTATSATAACTCASTSPSTGAAERPPSGPSSRRPRTSPRRTAAASPASTATAGPARRCCRGCTPRRSIDLFAAVKHLFDPADLLNPGVLVDPRPVDADIRLAARLREPRAHAAAGPRRRLGRRRGAPLHRRRQVRRRQHRHRRRDVPVVPGDPRREGLHPRPRPGPPGDGQRLAGHRRLAAPTRCTRRSTSAWPARAAPADCPTGIDMATYKAEALHQRYRRRLRPRSHYALGRLPRWARLTQPVAPARERGAAGRPVQRLAKAAGRHRPAAARAARSPRRPLRRWARGTRRRGADRRVVRRRGLGGLVHRRVRPGQRPRRRRGARGRRAAGRRGHRAGLLRADLGQHRPADRRPPDPGAHPRRAAPVRRGRRPGRRAGAVLPRRRCAPTRVELLPPTRARPRSPPASGTLAELLSGVPAGSRRTSPARRSWRSRTATTPRVLGWDADAALLPAPGPTVTRVGGCCGLAGNFGVEQGHYEVSVAVAEHDLLPAVRAARRGRGGARRRVLLPHPARRPRRGAGAAPRRAARPADGPSSASRGFTP